MATNSVIEETKPLLESNKEELKSSNKPMSTWIALLLAILVITGVIYYNYGNGTTTASLSIVNNVDSSVLPGYTLTIDESSTVLKSGEFITADNTKYSWRISVKEKTAMLSFRSGDTGFLIENEHSADSFKVGSLKLTLYPSLTVTIVPTSPTSDEDRISITEWIRTSVAVKHYIQFSMKLGASGYSGSACKLSGKMHKFAQWFFRIMKDDLQLNMDEYNSDIAKVNAIVQGSSTAMTGHSRSLLGNCEMISECDNDCIGMCGLGCDCWAWVCGDCSCWLGCYVHDEYCSCDCMLAYCCINVFWVECDGSGSCE